MNKWRVFVLEKFQNKGIGTFAAPKFWDNHPENWEVSVIPEHKNAANFWRRLVSNYSMGVYSESIQHVAYDSELNL